MERSEQETGVEVRRKKPSKEPRGECPRRRDQQVHTEQDVRGLTEDQAARWEGDSPRLGDGQGQAAQGVLRVRRCKPGAR